MKKKELIQKWLDHDLTDEELQAFKNLDAYDSLSKIDKVAKQYSAPNYDTTKQYKTLKGKLSTKENKKVRKLWWVAAAVVIVAGITYFTQFYTIQKSFNTVFAQEQTITLPDTSEVLLFPDSQFTFVANNWSDHRQVSLQGDAFFDVAKGKQFTVTTPSGTIEVLGTEFNVRHRDGFFEVACYEGKVRVAHGEQSEILELGDIFRVTEGKTQRLRFSATEMPSSSKSLVFKSVSLPYVLDAIERHYDITIHDVSNTDKDFTGAVDTTSLKDAIQTIALSFNLQFDIVGSEVTLKNK